MDGLYKVQNTISCGCIGDHDPNNHECWYTTLKLYHSMKGISDRNFEAYFPFAFQK